MAALVIFPVFRISLSTPIMMMAVRGLPSRRNRQTASISIWSMCFLMNCTSYMRRPSVHHIIFTPADTRLIWYVKTGGNMMSAAYDFAHSPATEFMSRPQHLLIDGRRVPASSGRTFKSLNPATGRVIATVAEGGEIDVEHAVAAARRAFEGPWRTMRASERGQILLRWADLLKQHS